MEKKLIYIADDEKNIRLLIKSFLENAGYMVRLFENGDLLYQAFEKQAPDLIVIDIMMPGTDGLSILEKIRNTSAVPVIIVSARDTEYDRITGISIGSDDYLIKPFSPLELVARIHGIFRRIALYQNQENQDILAFGAMKIDLQSRAIYYKDDIFEVSPTEFDFLSYLFKHKNKAVSREELLKEVWHFDMDIDTRATDDVVKRLRKKLSHTHIKISAVWGYGFRLELKDENYSK